MYNLIIKDILIQKKQVAFSIAYMAFILVAFQGMGEAMLPMGLVALTYMLSMTSCGYEEKNKSDIMLNSLPIKRTNIVAAKYLSVFVYFAMGMIAYVLFTKVIIMIQVPLKTYPITLEAFIGGFVAVSLMTGIWLPIYFKFGYMKLRVLNFVLFFLFFFGTSYLTKFFKEKQNSQWVQDIINFLNSQGNIRIALIIATMVIIFLIISYGLSVRFYSKREF